MQQNDSLAGGAGGKAAPRRRSRPGGRPALACRVTCTVRLLLPQSRGGSRSSSGSGGSGGGGGSCGGGGGSGDSSGMSSRSSRRDRGQLRTHHAESRNGSPASHPSSFQRHRAQPPGQCRRRCAVGLGRSLRTRPSRAGRGGRAGGGRRRRPAVTRKPPRPAAAAAAAAGRSRQQPGPQADTAGQLSRRRDCTPLYH